MSYRLELPKGLAITQQAGPNGPVYTLEADGYTDRMMFRSPSLEEVYHKAIDVQRDTREVV